MKNIVEQNAAVAIHCGALRHESQQAHPPQSRNLATYSGLEKMTIAWD